jgi:hypothetical protein
VPRYIDWLRAQGMGVGDPAEQADQIRG